MFGTELLTVEAFFQRRHELPEEGRWCELVRGEVVELSPPDALHCGVVLNVAKALGRYVQQTGKGCPCFDIGLVVARNPDTLRRANVAYFLRGPRFELYDRGFSEVPPELVIDVASSPDRRQTVSARVQEYLASGVRLAWILDPQSQVAHAHRKGAKHTLAADAALTSEDLLPGFRCEIGPLFDVPKW
ncbi:MAG: Uma2 family endonuclease [Planctomycetes bacterium]|nr:Uma2 family endonuclease [Planctomycetota bacterium]